MFQVLYVIYLVNKTFLCCSFWNQPPPLLQYVAVSCLSLTFTDVLNLLENKHVNKNENMQKHVKLKKNIQTFKTRHTNILNI